MIVTQAKRVRRTKAQMLAAQLEAARVLPPVEVLIVHYKKQYHERGKKDKYVEVKNRYLTAYKCPSSKSSLFRHWGYAGKHNVSEIKRYYKEKFKGRYEPYFSIERKTKKVKV